MLFENIRTLCEINGISGREQAVAAEIVRQIRKLADEVEIDNLGNVLAFKKGKERPLKKVMLAAHMDEVGLIVTSVTEDGLLRFSNVGGVNPKVAFGRRVWIGESRIPGVIGEKPIHLVDKEERGKAVPMDKMYIDIGAVNREDALAAVSLGDSVCFEGDYMEFGDGFVAAKALDDRVGCAILIEIMKEELPYDTWFAFTTQEEIGTRGAKAAAFATAPDISIIVETTASGDVSGVDNEKRVTVIGGGAVISYMDHGTIYDRPLYELAFQLAEENGIPCQTKTMIAGGNDSAAISVSRGGVRTVAVSVPCRYLHSPADMAKKADVEAVYQLTKALAFHLGGL